MNPPKLFYALISSALASAILLVTPHGFPHLGLAVLFISSGFWAYVSIKNPNVWTKIVFTGIIVCSLMLAVWANPALTFLNIFAILSLGALLVVSPKLTMQHPLRMLAIYGLVWSFLWGKIPKFNWNPWNQTISKKSALITNSYIRLIASISLTLVISLVLILIFSSANPVFSYVSSWIANKLPHLDWPQELSYLVWRLILFVAIGIFFNRLSGTSKKTIKSSQRLTADFPLMLPKMATTALCLVFIFMHGLLLINPQEFLSKIGITHSQSTREIFGQMALASFISLGLVTLRRDQKNLGKAISYLLLLCVVLLISIGLQSDYQYIAQFGLTHKRLYGLASVLWLFSASGVILYWLRRGGEHVVTRGVVVVSIGVLVLINFLNFDGLIATHSPRITQQHPDYQYLANNLSADAGTLWQQYIQAKERFLISKKQEDLLPLSALLYRIPSRSAISDRPIIDGSFNLSVFFFHSTAKKLPIEEEKFWLHSQEVEYLPNNQNMYNYSSPTSKSK